MGTTAEKEMDETTDNTQHNFNQTILNCEHKFVQFFARMRRQPLEAAWQIAGQLGLRLLKMSDDYD